jgi:ADP-heptose:LPS heptosyltransferase
MQKTASEIKSVLVYVGLDRLGDGLLKLPFVHGLKGAFPNAKITWFAGKETTVYARALAPLVEGYIDEIIEYGGVGLEPKELLRARPLKDRRFDLIIDTQKIVWTSLSARRIRHGAFISPAARFLFSSKKPSRGYKFPKAMQRQMLDLLEIASGRSFPTPEKLTISIPGARRGEAQRLLPKVRGYVGFAPGSGGRPKCWPLERYIQVAQNVTAQGETPVFIIGPQEEEWVSEITSALPDAVLPLQMGAADHGFDPMLTLALGERLSKAVSNDSGIAHMLAVAGTPLVALYGPTVYEKFPPMTEAISVIKAEKFGSREMSAIPIDAVSQALDVLPGRDPDA